MTSLTPRKFRPALLRLEDRTTPSALPAAYGQLPLTFEANQGQAAAGFDFLAHGGGYSLALAPTQAALALTGPAGSAGVRITLDHANATAQPVGLDPLATKSNYLVGSDPSHWHTGIPNFGRVEYRGVYPGIDLTYYANDQRQLEYDFTVAPGADPNRILQDVQGATVEFNAHAGLVLHTAAGDVTEQAPVAYQQIGGVRRAVETGFVLEGHDRVAFRLGKYDHSLPLVIDPVLTYSSYLDGTGVGVAVDSAGEAFVTGSAPAGFPTTAGAFGPTGSGVYVAKLNAAGTGVVYATYIGNAGSYQFWYGGYGIAVDAAGDAAIIGTVAPGFPTTPNALQPTATIYQSAVAELNPSGSGLIYSTYLPGTNTGSPSAYSLRGAIAFDPSGNLDVTGSAGAGFVTTPGAFQATNSSGTFDAFFASINPNPSLSGTASLVDATYLGGNSNDAGTGIAVDSAGNAYLTGFTRSTDFPTTAGAFQRTNGGGSEYDVFVAKVNPSLSGAASLTYSTYLGGSSRDGFLSPLRYAIAWPLRMGPGIAVDAAGDAYVTGSTTSSNFPVTPGAFQTVNHSPSTSLTAANAGDAFLTKLNPTGTGLVYSTYLGGVNRDVASGVAVDAAGNATVVGSTIATDFPTKNPIQAAKATGNDNNGGANADAFVTTFNATGTGLLFSTYLGGSADDFGFGVALDPAGNAYVAGQTNYYSSASNFPTTPGAYQRTAGTGFVAKISSPAGG